MNPSVPEQHFATPPSCCPAPMRHSRSSGELPCVVSRFSPAPGFRAVMAGSESLIDTFGDPFMRDAAEMTVHTEDFQE